MLKDSVAVPSRAVIIGPDGPFVYVVKEVPSQTTPPARSWVHAQYRLVTSGTENEGMTVVTKGLDAGEAVDCMEGHVRLSDRVKVRLPEDAKPAAGTPARPARRYGEPRRRHVWLCSSNARWRQRC